MTIFYRAEQCVQLTSTRVKSETHPQEVICLKHFCVCLCSPDMTFVFFFPRLLYWITQFFLLRTGTGFFLFEAFKDVPNHTLTPLATYYDALGSLFTRMDFIKFSVYLNFHVFLTNKVVFICLRFLWIFSWGQLNLLINPEAINNHTPTA